MKKISALGSILLFSISNSLASADISLAQEESVPQPIKAEAKVSKGIIYLIDAINDKNVSNLFLISHKMIFNGIEEIILVIDSAGGDTDAGISAYNFLSSLPVTLKTHNISNTSSAATFLYCAGSHRTASPGSFFLFHDGTASFASHLTPKEINGAIEVNRLRANKVQSITSKCLEYTDSEARTLLERETVLNADEAKSIGLTNKITDLSRIISDSVMVEYINDDPPQ